MSGLRLGSLFAGIGGFDLGFERAGFRTSWACEIDKHAQAVLRLRFPHAALFDDVRNVGAHNLAPVDVVTFGSPCQDLSVAGKRAGLAGGRSGLFHEAARVIRELRAAHGKPDLAVWENVPGAFSSNGGDDFQAVVRTMAELGALDVGWRVLDSRFFGVAQRRKRILLVADFTGRRADEILALRESLQRHLAEKQEAAKKAPRGPREGARGGGAFRLTGLGKYATDDLVSTVQARDFKDATDLAVLPAGYAAPVAGALCAGDGPRGVQGQFIDDGKLVVTFVPSVADPLVTGEQRTYTHEGTTFRTRNVVAPEARREEPFTLEIRGREDGRQLEYRQDGIANALRTANGGRDGLGIGGVAYGFDPIGSTADEERETAPTLRGSGVGGNAGHHQAVFQSGAVCATGTVTHALTAKAANGATEDGTDRGTPIVSVPMINMQGGKTSAVTQADGPSFTLMAMHGHDVHSILAPTPFDTTQLSHPANRSNPQPGDPCHKLNAHANAPAVIIPTLTASNDPSRSPQSTEVTQQVAAVHAATSIVRRLTPVECCRLQGFPDAWNEEGIDAAGRRYAMSDAARYKQLGNAVTVNVAEYLARRIAPLLQESQDAQADRKQEEPVSSHHEPAHALPAGSAGAGAAGCVPGACSAGPSAFAGASPMSCGATSSCASEAAAAAHAPASDV